MAAPTPVSAPLAKTSPLAALPALAALLLMGGAVGWSWRETVPPFAAERAEGRTAVAGTAPTAEVSPLALSTFANEGLQPGNGPEPVTGRDAPMFRGPEGTEFYRFRYERHGDAVTAGYRVRLGPGHEIYVIQEFDCAAPRVKPVAAGPSILGLQFEPNPQYGPLDDSHSDTRLRELFCAMKG